MKAIKPEQKITTWFTKDQRVWWLDENMVLRTDKVRGERIHVSYDEDGRTVTEHECLISILVGDKLEARWVGAGVVYTDPQDVLLQLKDMMDSLYTRAEEKVARLTALDATKAKDADGSIILVETHMDNLHK